MKKLDWLIRSCLGKKAYRSRKLAKQASVGVRHIFGKQMTFYRCDNCGCYHLAKETRQHG